MKKITLFAALFSALVFGSCGSDEDPVQQLTTDLDINVTATFNGEPLQTQKEYTYCDGRAMQFDLFNFYISNIVLLRETTPETPVTELKEIVFIDLSKSTPTEAAAGETLSIFDVPVGQYSGIQLGLGVSADLNRTQPEAYGSTHPLNKPSHYWSGWQSYIFAMIGGYADMNEDGNITIGGADSEVFTYHNGADVSYAVSSILKNITLEEGVKSTVHLNIELSEIFAITNSTFDVDNDNCLDINEFRGTHSIISQELNEEIMEDMMSRMAKSITIEL